MADVQVNLAEWIRDALNAGITPHHFFRDGAPCSWESSVEFAALRRAVLLEEVLSLCVSLDPDISGDQTPDEYARIFERRAELLAELAREA